MDEGRLEADGLFTNGHADDEPVWDGLADGSGQSWGDWYAHRLESVEAEGLHTGSGPAADGPGTEDAGGWTDWQAGTGSDGTAGEPQSAPPWRAVWGDFSTYVPAPDKPALVGFLAPDAGSMTVIFGDGGVGKGTLAAYLVAQATKDGQRVLVADAEGHPKEWHRRLTGFGADLSKVAYALHDGKSLSLDVFDSLRTFGLIVVDSAGYFVGDDGDLWGPSGATGMQSEAKAAGVPLLVLAHISKAGGGKAYGSGYWHNAPRVTYELTERDSDSVTMECRKSNDVLDISKGMRWTLTLTKDGLDPTGYSITPEEGDFMAETVEQKTKRVLADGEWHAIFDFTVLGYSAEAYRKVLLVGLAEGWVERRDVPTSAGGRDRAEYRSNTTTTL